jgi:ribosome-associated protein
VTPAGGPDAGGPTGPGADDGRIDLGQGVRLDPAELTWRFSASGGPGGQHVNTSNTKAEATFDIAGSPGLPEWARGLLSEAIGPSITVTASDTRSQSRNRDLAVARLAARLRRGLERRPDRRPTRPTLASKRRRLDAKRRRATLKNDRRRDRGAGDD